MRARLLDELRRAHGPCAIGASVHEHVREGAPAKVIVDVAESTHADLVVIASTGRTLVSSLLLGGVSDRVVRTSHVPVLVLRGPR